MRSNTAHSVLLGRHEGGELFLTPRDRASHMLMVGAPDSGKTNGTEMLFRQDVKAGRGCTLIDPMGSGDDSLYERMIGYCEAVGRKDVILFEPGNSNWVTPFDPIDREGEVSLSVERWVQATLTAWGYVDSDDMPRLEKWLRVFGTVAVQAGLMVPELEILMEPGSKVRDRLLPLITDDTIRRTLGFLDRMSVRDFLIQMESTHSKLMRFSGNTAIANCMGVGTNALDFRKIMDEGKVLLVNLSASDLSEQEQRLFGTLIVNGFYHHAMQRPLGAKPHYFFIDEAGMFATPALGNSLIHCRQKGLHLTFACQHLWQFRAENPKLYHSIKNGAGTKVLFRIQDREDAMELAGDMFPDLAKLRVKDEMWGTSYKIEDVYLPSVSESRSDGENWGTTKGHALTAGKSKGGAKGWSHGSSDSTGRGESVRIEDGLVTQSESTAMVLVGGNSEVDSWASSASQSHSLARQEGGSRGTTRSVTWSPSTKHTPYREIRSRIPFTLEEQRWMAAEGLMTTPTGRAFVKVKTNVPVMVHFPHPKVRAKPSPEYREMLLAANAIPMADARRIIEARRIELAIVPPKEAKEYKRRRRPALTDTPDALR